MARKQSSRHSSDHQGPSSVSSAASSAAPGRSGRSSEPAAGDGPSTLSGLQLFTGCGPVTCPWVCVLQLLVLC